VEDSKTVTPGAARQGQQATYTLQLVGDNTPASLSDVLPAGVSLAAGPATTPASVPPATYNGATRTIAWSGSPPDTVVVKVTYTVTVDTATTVAIGNTVTMTHNGTPKQLTAVLIANPRRSFLPVLRR
jgi:hypothetical protein